MQGEAAQLGVPGEPGGQGVGLKQLRLLLLEIHLQRAKHREQLCISKEHWRHREESCMQEGGEEVASVVGYRVETVGIAEGWGTGWRGGEGGKGLIKRGGGDRES